MATTHLRRIAKTIKQNEQGGGARGARTLLHTCLPLQYGARGHDYIHVYLYNDIMRINDQPHAPERAGASANDSMVMPFGQAVAATGPGLAAAVAAES